MTIEINIGDMVRLRKPHPCGSYEWEVVRVGADIGLKCLKCQRKVLLERGVFERRLKTIVPKSESTFGINYKKSLIKGEHGQASK